MANEHHQYKWTNYIDYIHGSNRTDTDFALGIFNNLDREKAISVFIAHMAKRNKDECLAMQEKQQITEDAAIKSLWIIVKLVMEQNFKILVHTKEMHI
ncbi:hypothetical protein [Geosporobacter ferrireducens]|uniref:hypothetical protein n=1 Tax=Geosporobacter ferrireducens TaxID=1424294 RepID=UPI0012EA294F|nr:hypothetical protein [Geosporobacter ferrireducens]